MHYAADESIGYGLKGLSHELNSTLERLSGLKAYGALEPDEFRNLCEQLDRDVFYSVETMASFDYGVSAGYNDYDRFWLYCYINDVFRVSENFDQMTSTEIHKVYFSLSKVCKAFNSMEWNLPKTANYFGMSLEAYDFEGDPSGVRNHLAEVEALVEAEQELLQIYLQPGNDGTVEAADDVDDAIGVIKKEFDEKWKGCTLTELYYAGIDISRQYQDWAVRNNAEDVIVLLSSFDVGSDADPSLNLNTTYENYMWILVRTDGGEWIHVDHGYYVPIL